MEAEGLEGVHIYRPSKKARTFFAVMGCFSFVIGVTTRPFPRKWFRV